MKRKLTPWFPPEIKPVHVGWYDVANLKMEPHFFPPWFFHWNGTTWDSFGSFPGPFKPNPYVVQDVPWRGLARKP